MYKKSSTIIVSLVFLVFSFGCLAGLSATTANTIKGNEPVLVPGTGAASLVARLSFMVNKITYKESDNSYGS